MAKGIWTEPALSDLQELIQHTSKDSIVYAERVGTHVVESPRRLEQFPSSGRIVPEFENEFISRMLKKYSLP